MISTIAFLTAFGVGAAFGCAAAATGDWREREW
jgi:hypothetical protein